MKDERELVAALRRRDQSALTQVFEQYADKIYRLAISVLHDEAQADGVVQDTFIVWHQHLRHQNPEIEIIDRSLTGHKPIERIRRWSHAGSAFAFL
jgi:hypothetical protein